MGESGVGDRLKEYRKILRMSQAELARKSNVSAAYLSELESGLGKRPSGVILLRLDRVVALLFDAEAAPVRGRLDRQRRRRQPPGSRSSQAIREFQYPAKIGLEAQAHLRGVPRARWTAGEYARPAKAPASDV